MKQRAKLLIVVEAALLFLFAVGIRTVNVDHGQYHDEYYHLLAARSWAAEGTLRIAEGVYDRGAVFTRTLGRLFMVFGESVVVARSFSVVLGSLCVLLVFLWTRRAAGRPAAWIASLLLCLAPGSIYVSQYIRFYAWHMLVFWIASICLYSLIVNRPSWPRRALLVALAVVCVVLAERVQITTYVGIVSLATWVAVEYGLRLAGRGLRSRAERIGLVAGILVAGFSAILLVLSDFGASLIAEYRGAALWNAEHRDELLYYHRLLRAQYATFWSLLPVGVLIALKSNRKPALFGATVLCTSVLLHSFAGMKDERYIVYVAPFFFVIWGIALAGLLPQLLSLTKSAGESLLSPGHRLLQPFRIAAIVAVVLAIIGGNRAFAITYNTLMGRPYRHTSDWSGAGERLEPWLRDSQVIVTTSGLEALYYLGDYDVRFGRSKLLETGRGAREFDLDRRTGKPIISSVESLRLVMSCFDTGLFVGDAAKWSKPVIGLDRDGAEFLQNHSYPVDLPAELGVVAFNWDIPPEREPGRDCSAVAAIADSARRRRQAP